MYTYSKVGTAETLSHRVQSAIEKSILQKHFVPGDKLPTEKQMCAMFGVSRTALREALQMLSIQGMVTIRKGSGIYVSEFSITDAVKPICQYLQMSFDDELIIKIFESRKMYEPQIAWLAARNRDEADVKLLEESLSKLKRSEPSSTLVRGEIDQNFRRIICQACKNPIISVQMEPIIQLIPRIYTRVYGMGDRTLINTVGPHQDIINAIVDQKTDAAKEAMITYLTMAEEHIHRIVNQHKIESNKFEDS